MKFNLKLRISLLTLLIPILLLSLPLPLYAANCDKKPDHPDCIDPPPDDGGNDTADPDWQILAVNADGNPTFGDDCVAFNPDLKGPGIAYLGFYDHFGYETCAETTTLVENGVGAVINIRLIDVKTDKNGKFTTIQLSGRNRDDGVVYESDAVEFWDTGRDAPTNEVYFTLRVDTEIEIFSCGTAKKKGNTDCDQNAGSISIYDLDYCPLGEDCPEPQETNP